MNVLHIIMLYNRLRQNPALDLYPRTFIFGAKAAPGYHLAKLIIKLINNVGAVINTDPVSRDRLRVYFVPNYRVSLAEKIIPAADVSEQISTAGKEASGTGNMKYMMNGALTLGTLDGANIEIVEEAGEENVFIFGLTAEEVEARRGHYNPRDCVHEHAETRQALELISQNHFSPDEPGIFHDIVRSLLDAGDPYFVLQDLPAYAEAQDRLERVYRDEEEWARKAILNVAFSGKFSSDRTILEYANEIWDARPCPIDMEHKRSHTIMQARSLLEDETTQ
jgi:starch phosphorylase